MSKHARPRGGPKDKDLEEEAAFKRGRRLHYPFSQLPDWVLFSSISPGAKTLYWALYVHVNQERKDDFGDTRVWPGQAKLLHISGIKSKTTLRKYLKELRDIGAAEWRTGRNRHNRLRTQTVYTVHDVPEEGYEGPATISEVYAAYEARDSGEDE